MKPTPAFWQRVQLNTKWKINLTLWGESFLPLFFVTCAFSALLLYLFRRLDLNFMWLSLALPLLLLGTGYYSWRKQRQAFFTPRDTLAFLDDKLELNTQLSLAYSGLGEWPREQKLPTCVKWRSPLPFLLWTLASLALVTLSLSVPLPASSTPKAFTAPPPALEQIEEWVEALKEMKELDQEKLQNLEEQAQELLERPREEMYSHSALEAADSLKDQMNQEMQEFSENLKRFQDALSTAPNEINADSGGQNAKTLQKALEAMEGKNLQLSKESMSGGKGAQEQNQKGGNKAGNSTSSQKFSQLSPEQKQKLKEAAQSARDQLKALNESLKNKPSPSQGECGNCGQCEKCLGQGNGKGKKLGSGKPTRGRGDAPLTLGDMSPEFPMEKDQLPPNPDADITLGEKIGEESGVFEVKDDGKRDSSAGKVASPSKGGQATWDDQYSPAEKEALKNFFK